MNNGDEFIYSSDDGVIFFCNKEKNSITKEVSDTGISQRFTYSLKEDQGIWLWIEKENCRIEFGEKDRYKDFGVAGKTKEEAKQFLIEKIVAPWKELGPCSFQVDVIELETQLRDKFV